MTSLHDLLARVEAALEPFSDAFVEGTEDYPDDMKVTVNCGRSTHYALRLGDFRRLEEVLFLIAQPQPPADAVKP